MLDGNNTRPVKEDDVIYDREKLWMSRYVMLDSEDIIGGNIVSECIIA